MRKLGQMTAPEFWRFLRAVGWGWSDVVRYGLSVWILVQVFGETGFWTVFSLALLWFSAEIHSLHIKLDAYERKLRR